MVSIIHSYSINDKLVLNDSTVNDSIYPQGGRGGPHPALLPRAAQGLRYIYIYMYEYIYIYIYMYVYIYIYIYTYIYIYIYT